MRPRTAVIPVAGLGTRFLPATKAMPKEMLTVVDKPLVQYAVEEAFAAGIERIIFVTGRGKEMLADHFDYTPELEESLRNRNRQDPLQQIRSLVPSAGCLIYTRQNEPLGLGHAIWCARHLVGDGPFAILLPDDLVWSGPQHPPVMKQMCDQYESLQHSMVAIMNVEAQETNKYGILDPLTAPESSTSPLVQAKGLVEKPAPHLAPSRLAIIGRYILRPEIFSLLGKKQTGAGGEIQLTDAMAMLMQNHPIYGFLFQGTRYDCGDKVGFQMANLALAMEQPEMRTRLLPFLNTQLSHWQTQPASSTNS
ncbi:UTP--glucose-1-phosphate uridylyltransferase GalU [Candidatus Magnetaquicoccus inordinatus]|uniref:UTP--glucose-1-phosphate uridylyltransferase GalU n=1 Tax=Candidatus Magnetaquicoccus inordinatus TaxID=2496818 RepID=UPI00102C859D|nr:UTP--glucose-1-phosphate uridylyltransferase GalU [Candidatus Magnetaquicoccus inordinatus]